MPKPEGNATLLPEPFQVRKDAVDKAAPAARAALDAPIIRSEARRVALSPTSRRGQVCL